MKLKHILEIRKTSDAIVNYFFDQDGDDQLTVGWEIHKILKSIPGLQDLETFDDEEDHRLGEPAHSITFSLHGLRGHTRFISVADDDGLEGSHNTNVSTYNGLRIIISNRKKIIIVMDFSKLSEIKPGIEKKIKELWNTNREALLDT